MPRSRQDNTAEFANAPDAPGGYVLRLFIAGASSRSSRAVRNIQRICERYLSGRYELEVVDLYQQPARAALGQVLAAPTLVKEEPQPPRRMVGDLSNEARVLSGLGLPSSEQSGGG